MNLRPFALVGIALTSLGAVAALDFTPPPVTPVLDLPPMGSLEPPAAEPLIREQSHVIAAGETAGALLRRLGAPVDAVLAAARGAYDLTRIHQGKVLNAVYFDPDPVPVQLRYGIDEDHTLILDRAEAGWVGHLEVVQYDTKEGVRDVVVKSSLWQAAIDAGLRPSDIAALASVFEYDVDFNTEIQPGASAHMVIDELWKDGAVAKLGQPRAVRFKNGDKTYMAIRFTRSDGGSGYYDADGMARKKAFLRSPLAFSKVTSGFSLARYHPILKISRPHLGVDFGAPEGTPVRAVGDGVVVSAGREGGHGNFVKIKHQGTYASSYSHLSRIDVKVGEKVHQGELVGLVGSTGLATGPHLHFQFWINDQIVNPLKIELPQQEQLPQSEMSAFIAERDRWLALLDGPSPEAR